MNILILDEEDPISKSKPRESFRASGNTRQINQAAWTSLLLRVALGTVFIANGVTICIETVSGLALLIGIWVRAAATVLAIVMLGALFTVHLPHGFFLPHGIEYVLTLAVAIAALAVLGPGRWALQSWRESRG